jgi:hypothetical protein
MLAFFSPGPMELLVIVGILFIFALPLTALIIIISILAKKRKQDQRK